MALNQFPQCAKLGFLKSSKLGFRIVRGQIVKYQEIGYFSSVGMHGFLSFLAPGTLDDTLYNKLSIEIALQNTGNPSSRATMTRTITPGASSDTYTFDFVPDEATCLAYAQLFFGYSPAITTKTSTLITHTFENETGGTIGTQRFELSEPIDIRVWQHLMVDNLNERKPQILAKQQLDIANGLYTYEDTWDTVWNIQDTGSYFTTPGSKMSLLTGGALSNGLPALDGKILQIDRGLNSSGEVTFEDVLGINAAYYFPGTALTHRLYQWPGTVIGDDARMLSFIPTYQFPDIIYSTMDLLSCSSVSHRIHQSPVYVRLDRRTVPNTGFGLYDTGAGFDWLMDAFGPDVYDAPAVPTVGYPVDAGGRVQFDTECPANVIGQFWTDGFPDQFYVNQIYNLNASTNVNGFVIPP